MSSFFATHWNVTGEARRITLETSRVKESKESVSCLCYVPRGVDNTLTVYFVSFILKSRKLLIAVFSQLEDLLLHSFRLNALQIAVTTYY